MDVEDVLALLDAPIYERRELPNGFDPWRIQRFDLSAVHRQGYQKGLAKGIEVTCEVCGKVRVVHPMMKGKALACNEHRDRAYQDRCRAQGKRYYRPWTERYPRDKANN